MNKKNYNPKYKKVHNNNSNNISHTTRNQRDLYISKIMDKYGLSFQEAEQILSKIERINKISSASEKTNFNFSQSNSKQRSVQPILENNDKEKFVNSPQELDVSKEKFVNSPQELDVSKNNKEKFVNSPQELDVSEDNKQNVDMIIGKIIPNYNQQVSIELDHVDLTFEVFNEKVDTIKEKFIRTIRREKSEKTKIHALKDISFQIYAGEKVGIIGYNGAGKSTLLNVISGIYPPDKGSVVTYGNISPLLSLGAGFDYNFSGRQNILLNGAVLGYDKEFLESKMDEIIEFSELGELIDIPIKNYSSGMMAKLGFSIATAVEPDILIIDEILGVGDVNFQKKSRDKIRSLMGGGTTVLLVSHSIPQVRELCDKAIWIDKGNLREFGEVNNVCNHYLKDAEKASNEQLANIQFR